MLKANLICTTFLLCRLLTAKVLPTTSVRGLYIRCSVFMFLTYCSANCSKGSQGQRVCHSCCVSCNRNFRCAILHLESCPKGCVAVIVQVNVFLPCFEFGRFYHEKLENTIISTALHILQSFSEFSFFSSPSVKILNTLRQSA